MSALLELRSLRVDLPSRDRSRRVLHEVSLQIAAGEAVALVGESGSGKSMTVRAIARLLPPGSTVTGEILFDNESVTELDGEALRRYRTRGIGVVFQDPTAHINPVRRIGDFLTEALRTSLGLDSRAAEQRVLAMLDQVGVDSPRRRLRQYPHELSGGLLQRVMIASVVAMDPQLILADEPTTALDVTTQADVMAVLDELRREHRLALLLVTHDLELAAAVCDRTAVMYAGSIVETQASERLHEAPLHPYTAALTRSRPSLEVRARLSVIPGRPRSGLDVGAGCPFAERCGYAAPSCSDVRPELKRTAVGEVACLRAAEFRKPPWPRHADQERTGA